MAPTLSIGRRFTAKTLAHLARAQELLVLNVLLGPSGGRTGPADRTGGRLVQHARYYWLLLAEIR